MKHIIIFFTIATMASLQTNGQCTTKVDEFTGKVTTMTKKVKIDEGGTLGLFKTYGDDCKYKVFLRFVAIGGQVALSLSEDSDDCVCSVTAIAFKFSDGTILNLTNVVEGNTVKTSLGEERYTFFAISREQLDMFVKKTVAKFRATLSGCKDHPKIEEPMESSDAAAIQTNAGCVVSALNH